MDGAAGIDIGGTKILAQRFAPDWSVLDARRLDTPDSYPALLTAVAQLADWAGSAPLGLATAGVFTASGRLLAANLASHGHPFQTDIAQALGRAVPVLNDARALVLSLGTGLGAGYVARGRLAPGQARFGGEIGHMSLPLRIDPALPRFTCGFGREGSVETLVSGDGLARLAAHYGERPSDRGTAWRAWIQVMALVLADLCLAYDPEIIVLGGGAAQADGLIAALQPALALAMLPGLPAPALALAQGGTPALGAALEAAHG